MISFDKRKSKILRFLESQNQEIQLISSNSVSQKFHLIKRETKVLIGVDLWLFEG